ncbi:GntR family transcriptional regulator [Thermoflavimicrobium daqui]|uniref:GntR family transcriptional regulator n=2 Tax=Thermoflavimicrobium daqui TaxID=2137476 RepID=A0A364K649_9BACL|nr:GntR family transcriptional regulator [Thermoflavimicrobium daqui]
MMKFTNDQPIYLQLKNEFYRKICKGVLRSGDKLPSVRETAVEVGVNPNTVQRTYSDMERDGIIEKRRGQGSFVTNNQEIIQQLRKSLAQEQVDQFYHSMQQMGFTDEEILLQIIQTIKKEGK